MTHDQIQQLLAAQRAALDAHRWAMPQERDVTPADQALWDATQTAVYALEDALRAAPPAPAPELVALVQEWQRSTLACRKQPLSTISLANDMASVRAADALLAWTPAAPVEPPARPETAAPTPAPTREQLQHIEWRGGGHPKGDSCPACAWCEFEGHAPHCWLAAALSSPVGETPAPTEKKIMSAHPLADTARLVREQHNRGTAHPLFVVQRKRRIYGFDPDYCDNVVWINPPNDYCEATPEEHAVMEAAYDETGDEPEDWQRTGYQDQWEFVTVCFTEEGAKAYLKVNGHNIRGETRIYAESAYRNAEMIKVREYLLALPGETPADRKEPTK